MFEEDGSLNITYDLYLILELKPPCTDAELTRAYRKVALKYHPDKATGNAEKFQQIKIAHDVLKDPIKREYYDRFGDAGLNFLNSDENQLLAGNDTSSIIGKIIIKVLTKPTRIIPMLLFIALLGGFFITFLNFVDKKLYYNEMKTTPWYLIFSLFWIYSVSFLIPIGILFYAKLKKFKIIYDYNYSSDNIKDIQSTRRKYLAFFMTLKSVSYNLFSVLFNIILIYCTVKLSLNLDKNGNLFDGEKWSVLFDPLIKLLIIFSSMYFILSAVTIFKYKNSKWLWTERSLILANEAYDAIAHASFLCFLMNWLDSINRNNISLFLIFSLLYVKLIFDSFRISVENYWKIQNQREILTSSVEDPDLVEEIEYKIENSQKYFNIFLIVVVSFIILQIALINLHLAGYWPGNWSMTLCPIVICVFCSILFFGCCLPCIVTCMQFSVPMNSFDKVFGVGEDTTIIDIPNRRIRFGYGLAPVQPRINYRTRT